MPRRKLERFQENEQIRNIIQPGKSEYETIKGNWHDFFGNSNPIELELACGRGEYTTGMAASFSDRNYVGIDLKGDRMWKGCMKAKEMGLNNVAFLRIQIQFLEKFFAKNEVKGIWIIFPDPQPKRRNAKNRLTHPLYLNRYLKVLEPGGWIRLKTDDNSLFDFTLDVLEKGEFERNKLEFVPKDVVWTEDLYQSPLLSEHQGIQTRYERTWLEEGKKIKYIKFRV